MSADIVKPKIRSRMMAGIWGRDTRSELQIRAAPHRRGFRFRLYRRDLPGRPDLVFPKYMAVILVHGCFWHGHDCHLFRWPGTRGEFWRTKITSNRERDHRQLSVLLETGWRVSIIWECALKGRERLPMQMVIGRCTEWLESGETELELRGNETRIFA